MYFDNPIRIDVNFTIIFMPAKKVISEEELLHLLYKRYLFLRIKLEKTAYQIKDLGGICSGKNELKQNSREKHKQELVKWRFFKNKWVHKIITVMQEQSKPWTAKEISANLYAGQCIMSLYEIQRQVMFAIRLLLNNGIIEKHLNSKHKYILNTNKISFKKQLLIQ